MCNVVQERVHGIDGGQLIIISSEYTHVYKDWE